MKTLGSKTKREFLEILTKIRTEACSFFVDEEMDDYDYQQWPNASLDALDFVRSLATMDID